jgi:hypothetical protein
MWKGNLDALKTGSCSFWDILIFGFLQSKRECISMTSPDFLGGRMRVPPVIRAALKHIPGLDAARSAILRHRYSHAQSVIDAMPVFTPNSAGAPYLRASLALQSAANTPALLARLIEGAAAPLPLVEFCRPAPAENAERLRRLFDHYGSDKASLHNYHLLYSEIILRADRPIQRLLEIGIGSNNPGVASNMGVKGKPGASLRAFRDFLPEAQIIGADIDRGVMFREDRIVTHVVDQTDAAALVGLGQQIDGDLDVLIDDGLHSSHANLSVLLFGLQKVRDGGWIIIEDIGAEASPIWQLVAALIGGKHETHLIQTRTALVFAVHKH